LGFRVWGLGNLQVMMPRGFGLRVPGLGILVGFWDACGGEGRIDDPLYRDGPRWRTPWGGNDCRRGISNPQIRLHALPRGAHGRQVPQTLKPRPHAPPKKTRRLQCFQTPTGVKFLILAEPRVSSLDALLRQVYSLYRCPESKS
jgi:hypothetical protein